MRQLTFADVDTATTETPTYTPRTTDDPYAAHDAWKLTRTVHRFEAITPLSYFKGIVTLASGRKIHVTYDGDWLGTGKDTGWSNTRMAHPMMELRGYLVSPTGYRCWHAELLNPSDPEPPMFYQQLTERIEEEVAKHQTTLQRYRPQPHTSNNVRYRLPDGCVVDTCKRRTVKPRADSKARTL